MRQEILTGVERRRRWSAAEKRSILAEVGVDGARVADVQPLAAVFADLVHDTAAARADQAVGLDDLFDARQPGRQIAEGALRCGLGRLVARLGGARLFLGLDLRQGDGQVLKRQLPLIFGQLFRALAMQGVVRRCSGPDNGKDGK